MPELPEVESIKNILKSSLTGKVITGIKFFFTGMLGPLAPYDFTLEIRGKKILDLSRRGKYLLFYLSGGKILEVHLRMTGAFFLYPAGNPVSQHIRAIFFLNDGNELHFRDVRKFGTFRLREKKEMEGLNLTRLGPDLLDDVHDIRFFREILKKKPRCSLKTFLLDQRNVAGLGNIYTDEALFRSGLHPVRHIETLSPEEEAALLQSIKDVLREGIVCGGVSVSDYLDPMGRSGSFQLHLQVYRRENEPCFKCGGLIVRHVIAGRGTYFCPSCQKQSPY